MVTQLFRQAECHGITQHDNVQLARRPAWHRLGTVFADAPSWYDGVVKPLGWTVSKVPLVAHVASSEGDDAIKMVEVPDNFGIIREDIGKCIGVVGNQYRPIQNTEAFAVVEHLVASGQCEIESSGSLFEGRKVWLLLKVLECADVEIERGDVVKPYLLVTTSHDGSSSLRVGFTAIRVVCNNTLTASVKKGCGFTNIRHTTNADQALALIAETIDVGKRELASTVELYRKMKEVKVSLAQAEKIIKAYRERNKEATNETDEVSKREQNLRDELLHLYSMAKGESAWHLYNAINEYNCHIRGRSDETRLDKQWFSDGEEDRELLKFIATASMAA